jgi:hypothetical protein
MKEQKRHFPKIIQLKKFEPLDFFLRYWVRFIKQSLEGSLEPHPKPELLYLTLSSFHCTSVMEHRMCTIGQDAEARGKMLNKNFKHSCEVGKVDFLYPSCPPPENKVFMLPL